LQGALGRFKESVLKKKMVDVKCYRSVGSFGASIYNIYFVEEVKILIA